MSDLGDLKIGFIVNMVNEIVLFKCWCECMVEVVCFVVDVRKFVL